MKSVSVGPEEPGVGFVEGLTVDDDSDSKWHAMEVRIGPGLKSWPDTYEYLGNYPQGELQAPWSEHLQGITHDEAFWYITGHDPAKIIRWPANSIQGPGTVQEEGSRLLPPGYNHLGDPDYRNGFLYIPLEEDGDTSRVAAIGAYDASRLKLVAHAEVPLQGTRASWCAFSPVNGLLYSSNSTTTEVLGYQADLSRTAGGFQLRLQLKDRVTLRSETGAPTTVEITGGAISARGHLYLAADNYRESIGGILFGNIVGFDMLDGRLNTKLLFQRSGLWVYPEGLDLWDLDDRPDVPGPGGQLHFILINIQAVGRDSFWVKHWRAQPRDHV